MSHAIGLAECLADGDIQWGGRYLTRETRTASEGGLREGSDSGLYREGFLGENPVGTHPYSAEPVRDLGMGRSGPTIWPTVLQQK